MEGNFNHPVYGFPQVSTFNLISHQEDFAGAGNGEPFGSFIIGKLVSHAVTVHLPQLGHRLILVRHHRHLIPIGVQLLQHRLDPFHRSLDLPRRQLRRRTCSIGGTAGGRVGEA